MLPWYKHSSLIMDSSWGPHPSFHLKYRYVDIRNPHPQEWLYTLCEVLMAWTTVVQLPHLPCSQNFHNVPVADMLLQCFFAYHAELLSDSNKNLSASLTPVTSGNHPAVWPVSPLHVAEFSARLTLACGNAYIPYLPCHHNKPTHHTGYSYRCCNALKQIKQKVPIHLAHSRAKW